MTLLLRKLLMLFFALWLPISSVAAAMMPQCSHDKVKQMQSAHAAEHAGEHHHDSRDQASADDGGAAGECAQCGLCLFASTPWLSGAQHSLETGGTFAVIDGIFAPLHSLVFPPADRPPRAAA